MSIKFKKVKIKNSHKSQGHFQLLQKLLQNQSQQLIPLDSELLSELQVWKSSFQAFQSIYCIF